MLLEAFCSFSILFKEGVIHALGLRRWLCRIEKWAWNMISGLYLGAKIDWSVTEILDDGEDGAARLFNKL